MVFVPFPLTSFQGRSAHRPLRTEERRTSLESECTVEPRADLPSRADLLDVHQTKVPLGRASTFRTKPRPRPHQPPVFDRHLGQATKGARWMPRHQEAMKDVTTCDKPRGAGRKRRSVDLRMGQPGGRNGPSSCAESIGVGGQPGEVKYLSTRRKGNQPRLR